MTDVLTHTDAEATRELPRPGLVPPPPVKRQSTWRSLAATAAIAALIGGGVAAPVALYFDEDATTPTQATPVADTGSTTGVVPGLAQAGGVSGIAEAVGPSVARVDVSGSAGQGSGSAVVYRVDGYLLTNNHVVADANRVRVTFPDGTEQTAEVVGTDPRSDLAVLRVERTDLPVPEFATASPRSGDTAVAIGAPFGLDGSVTAGIVSALGRTVSTPGSPLIDLIQTDAPINPGNSGGALVDANSRVMGINTAILSPSGGNNGIGFAIPIVTASAIADQLIETGVVRHAFLGVQGTTVDPQIAEQYGLAADEGAVISAVTPGSPAQAADLAQGDIVTGVDDGEVASMADLAGRIAAHQPGDSVSLSVVRDGTTLTVEVELGEAPADN